MFDTDRIKKLLIGMIHVQALPGTPRHCKSMTEIVDTAVEEGRQLRDAGFDAVLLENMHDVPYLKGAIGPEITAAMTAVATSVRDEVCCPMGIQILAGANKEALAVAHAAGAEFVRVEAFAFGHIADEGWLEASAGELLRYRKTIGADKIQIWADVKKKHSSHAVTSDVSLAQACEATEFFGADALIITGSATGMPTSPDDLIEARSGSRLPLVVGSGATPDNLPDLLKQASGIIVGSYIKQDGLWSNPLDKNRMQTLISKFKELG